MDTADSIHTEPDAAGRVQLHLDGESRTHQRAQGYWRDMSRPWAVAGQGWPMHRLGSEKTPKRRVDGDATAPHQQWIVPSANELDPNGDCRGRTQTDRHRAQLDARTTKTSAHEKTYRDANLSVVRVSKESMV